jgi:hypothetical protein
MLWRDTIDLITIVPGQDAEGGPIETPTYRQVFANKKDVRQSEFYQSAAIGFKPSMMYEIMAIEYADETKARVGTIDYFIARTFSKNGEKLEIVLSKLPMR